MSTANLGKTKVEIRIFSTIGGSAKKFFRKIFWLSKESMERLFHVGSPVLPFVQGLRQGTVDRVTQKDSLPKVWVATDSPELDLEQKLKKEQWEEVSCE